MGDVMECGLWRTERSVMESSPLGILRVAQAGVGVLCPGLKRNFRGDEFLCAEPDELGDGDVRGV